MVRAFSPRSGFSLAVIILLVSSRHNSSLSILKSASRFSNTLLHGPTQTVQHMRSQLLRIRGAGAASEPLEAEDAFVLHYHSRWPMTYIHFSLDGGKTWSIRPGKVRDRLGLPRVPGNHGTLVYNNHLLIILL